VNVISRAATCANARADQRAFPSTDQSAGARPNRGAYADSFRRFAFTRFRIVPATMPVGIRRWSERRNQHEHREN
jgi:hypothetical protein